MMTRFMIAGVLATTLLAQPQQTTPIQQLLQKGIFAQETSGELDNAIQIYRQILVSLPPREIAAEAQYRLAQSLLKKGDLNGASLETQKLAKDYPDQQALITRLASSPKAIAIAPPVHLNPPDESAWDLGRTVTVSGEVTQVVWVNPRAHIRIKDSSGAEWDFAATSPNSLIKQGWTRNSVKTGDRLTITGSPAKDGTKNPLASTIIFADGVVHYDKAKDPPPGTEVPQVFQFNAK